MEKTKLTSYVSVEHKNMIIEMAEAQGLKPSNLVTMWILEKYKEFDENKNVK